MKISPTLPTPKWTPEADRSSPLLKVWHSLPREKTISATLPEGTKLKAFGATSSRHSQRDGVRNEVTLTQNSFTQQRTGRHSWSPSSSHNQRTKVSSGGNKLFNPLEGNRVGWGLCTSVSSLLTWQETWSHNIDVSGLATQNLLQCSHGGSWAIPDPHRASHRFIKHS